MVNFQCIKYILWSSSIGLWVRNSAYGQKNNYNKTNKINYFNNNIKNIK